MIARSENVCDKAPEAVQTNRATSDDYRDNYNLRKKRVKFSMSAA